MKNKLTRILFRIGDGLLWLLVLAGFLWTVGAIWNLNYLPVWLARGLSIVCLAAGPGFLFYSAKARSVTRDANPTGAISIGRKLLPRLVMVVAVPPVYLLTLFIQPTNDRNWAADQTVLPVVTIQGDRVTIENFHDFQYETPDRFEPRFATFSFDLSQLETVWFVVQRFTRFNGMAHTFVSFGLDTPTGKKYFSISVEIRREQDELYSPIRGLYRQYELMYVVGSEQDLIGVRTNIRENDRVYLFRANATPRQVRQLFRHFADRIERLRHQPEFYNTFRNNCTNNIVVHTWSLTDKPINPMSPRIVFPGYSDRFAFNEGLIGNVNQSFAELKSASRIDEVARKAGIDSDFSTAIRQGVGN